MVKSKGRSEALFLSYAWRDLKRQKVRTAFAVFGVMISILLLTVIGSLADSMSFSYLDQATAQVGSSDIVFTKVIEADVSFDPYFDEDLVENRLEGEIEEIEEYFPRILSLVQTDYYSSSYNKTIRKQILFYGLNSTLEQNNGKMGNLFLSEYKMVDGEYQWEPTSEVYKGPIPDGHCIVTDGFARLYNITQIGEEITVTYSSNEQTLIIDAIVEQDKRFTAVENTLVITELPQAQEILNQEGKVNYVMTILKNRANIYDSRNIDETIRKLRVVGEKIQDNIGFDYSVTLPKIAQLEQTQDQSMQMNMMFGFLTFFSMLITGILINSILSTSIEEKIREFGVLRTLGARKKFCFQLVLTSGTLIATIGTIAGTAIGAFAAPPFLEWYFGYFDLWNIPIDFIIRPITIFYSILIGIGVTTAISIIPALKAGRTQLTKAIDPSKSNQEDKYHIEKEGSANVKLMVFGLGFGFIGIIIFLIFPAVVSTGNTNLITSLLIILLFVVLIGLVLVTIGLVPILQKLIGWVLKPFIRRYYPVYKLSLHRYRRRNTGTTVMFALTFAFIFFVSTMLQMQTANSRALIEFQHGSDLVISNTGAPSQNNTIDLGFYNELKQLPGVRSAAPTYHNSLDVSLAAGLLVGINEGELNINDVNFGQYFGTVDKLEANIGDIGDYKDYYCNLIGINESYEQAVRSDLLMWDEETGSSDESLDKLYNTENACIIAKVFADALNINKLGEKIRLTMYDGSGESPYRNVSTFTVVGVSKGMPGYYNMRSAQVNLYVGSGVLLNSEDYCRVMNWGDPQDPDTIIDKIFIKLIDNDKETVEDVQSYIQDYFADEYSFEVNEAITLLEFMEDQNNTTSTIMETILFFSIIVSLFGLLSSMYSTLLERMFEIGILRAMGLKPYEVRNLLIAESLTIMLSAGSAGMGIGILVAYLLQTNVAVITEMPVVVSLNLGTLASTFLVSIAVSIVGMIFITRKVRKWRVVDILRSSFS